MNQKYVNATLVTMIMGINNERMYANCQSLAMQIKLLSNSLQGDSHPFEKH